MRRLVLALCLAALGPAGAPEAQETLVFNIDTRPGSEQYGMVRAYAEAICAHAGFQCRFLSLPLERAVELMRAGKLDGEFGRVREFAEAKGLTDSYLLIDYPFVPADIFVLTPADQPSIGDWSTLTGRKRRVGYLRGTYYYEHKLAAPDSLAVGVPLDSTGQCPRMLVTRRVEACLTDGWSWGVDFQDLIEQGAIRRGPSLEMVESYLFLNTSRASFAPLFLAAMAAAKMQTAATPTQ